MIYGIGTDIIRISRIAAALERHGDRFAARILGADEMEKFKSRSARAHARGVTFLATRFAAKEAFSKAIGLGMRRPMTWRAMQELNAPGGKPVVVLSGALQQWFAQQGLSAQVSITDEAEYGVAFVIVEK
jgi:holo-[acyl-carrier protein] synthase